MRQALFITILRDHDQRIDRLRIKVRVAGEQGLGGLYAQVGGFLLFGLARQERRADLAEHELFVLAELRTLNVVVQASGGHVTRDAFDANHSGFPMKTAKDHHSMN
ncbi:hypothetical protein D3C76_1320150 [compost metagenome]